MSLCPTLFYEHCIVLSTRLLQYRVCHWTKPKRSLSECPTNLVNITACMRINRLQKVKDVRMCLGVNKSQGHGASPAIWDHTCHPTP